MKRGFDIVVSFLILIFILPLLLIISLAVLFDSKGGVFYRQVRVGKNGKNFKILKFRTMFTNSDKKGLLTVGMNDSRITRSGYWLRKHKLDELPQLINVLVGDMSLVGPRPEVPKYVEMYTGEQRKVLLVRPGITDYASLKYRNENEILAKSKDPEKEYIEVIMPEKISINMQYIGEASLGADLKIIWLTIKVVFKG
ncbi:MAG TPA: sugar transferase [Bacteroidales bacterium]|nr:sugar transferase [Bacteroidales bacterium]HOE04465.1 sugar transferase [Bacteroidales bacterium]